MCCGSPESRRRFAVKPGHNLFACRFVSQFDTLAVTLCRRTASEVFYDCKS